jgi:glycosyltransferase involved in cell wall biosynthesis
LIHNTHYNDLIRVINPLNGYVIYNSEWVKDKLRYPQESYVLHPPVDHKEYTVRPTGKAIALVNCYKPKGGDILVELAKALPKRKFIGVFGYGDQVVGDQKNITYLENTDDIKAVYRKSRIVIMPSTYESFGRVAVEASASGIPVVVTNTPGLREALDYAGLFIMNRDNIEEWVKAIEDLDDDELYKKVGSLGKKRAKEITAQSERELEGLEKWLLEVAKKQYHE